MKKSNHIVMLIILSCLLSGCWDLDENERMFYIHGLGVDYKDGLYEVYMQIISFANVAKSEQVNQDVIQTEVSSATGRTFTEALFKLYHAIDEEVYWGHLSFFIVTEDVMKDGRINSIINTLTQYSELRYQTWVYCTDEPLQDLLLALPLLKRAVTLTKLADPMNSYEQASYIEPLSIRKLIIRLNEPSHDVTIPYVTLKKDWETQQGEDKSIEVSGVGIISPKQFKGFLKGEKAKGLQWISKETKRAQITSTIKKDEHITIVLRDLEVKIEPVIKGKDVQFDIHLNTTVSLNSHTETVSKKEIREAVKKTVKKEIETAFTEGLKNDADVYRLSEVLYRNNLKTWKKVQKNGKVKLTEDSIRNIHVNIQKISSGRKSFETTIE